jgi:hypothetical protein
MIASRPAKGGQDPEAFQLTAYNALYKLSQSPSQVQICVAGEHFTVTVNSFENMLAFLPCTTQHTQASKHTDPDPFRVLSTAIRSHAAAMHDSSLAAQGPSHVSQAGSAGQSVYQLAGGWSL